MTENLELWKYTSGKVKLVKRRPPWIVWFRWNVVCGCIMGFVIKAQNDWPASDGLKLPCIATATFSSNA